MSKHRLTHPETKQTVETTDEHLAMYQSQGWVEVKPAEKPDPKD